MKKKITLLIFLLLLSASLVLAYDGDVDDAIQTYTVDIAQDTINAAHAEAESAFDTAKEDGKTDEEADALAVQAAKDVIKAAYGDPPGTPTQPPPTPAEPTPEPTTEPEQEADVEAAKELVAEKPESEADVEAAKELVAEKPEPEADVEAAKELVAEKPEEEVEEVVEEKKVSALTRMGDRIFRLIKEAWLLAIIVLICIFTVFYNIIEYGLRNVFDQQRTRKAIAVAIAFMMVVPIIYALGKDFERPEDAVKHLLVECKEWKATEQGPLKCFEGELTPWGWLFFGTLCLATGIVAFRMLSGRGRGGVE